MVRPQNILGMNGRVQLYTKLNSRRAKRYGFSKLRTKLFMQKHSITVAKLYARLENQEDLRNFDFHNVHGSFAMKPASGSAGKGIVIIDRKKRNQDVWVDINGREFSEEDLRLHVSDILDGQYSTWGSQHSALIEERVPIHPDLLPYAAVGTPDVRVIVYHRIPVMAMMRLPTEASGGRANLDQGAIGLGIDLGTGKTTYGVSGKKIAVSYLPGTNTSVQGIQIPFWIDVLKTAVRAANATGLTFMGCDIFVHPEKGPMVAEVNAYPGLSIQLANHAGLRARLERVEGITARNVLHAVKLGQSLFADNFPGPGSEVDRPILNLTEHIFVLGDDEKFHETLARVNTQRNHTAVAEEFASQLKLNEARDLLYSQRVEEEGRVPVVAATMRIKDRVINTSVIVSKKLNHKKHNVELGRKDLGGFLVSGETLV